MASYLSSYFGGGASASSNPQYQQQYSQQYPQQGPPTPQPAATWGGTFSNRIGALRKALTKDNEEDDPDNEDCSHVSNVLRAYYTEKGRAFPEWLPPDPTRPAVTPPVQQSQTGQYGNMYPGQYGTNNAPHSRGNSGGRGGISDLWDSGPGQQQQQAPQAQSLRAQRPVPQSLKGLDPSGRQAGSDSYTSQARPLPSQRAGSYQNPQSMAPPLSTGNPRDRLRARLQGGSGNSARSTSPGKDNYERPNSVGGLPSTGATQSWSNNESQYGTSGGGYGGSSYQQRSNNYR